MAPRKYDSTVARIAGNIMSGVYDYAQLHKLGQGAEPPGTNSRLAARGAVVIARAIIEEVERTEPAVDSPPQVRERCPDGWHEAVDPFVRHRKCRKCGLEWDSGGTSIVAERGR